MTDIKELRTKAGMTQEQLATLMDVSTNTVQNWENGKTSPKKEVMNSLLKVLGVTDPSKQAEIIGNIGISGYKEDDKEELMKMPSFLFEDGSAEIEKIVNCRASAEELDMLAYYEYMSRNGKYAKMERRNEIYPLEFSFFERYGGFNKTMNSLKAVKKRLGSLKQEALEFAEEHPGCEYRLLSYEKKYLIDKIGVLTNRSDYRAYLKGLYNDLSIVANGDVFYTKNEVVQRNEISQKLAKIVTGNFDCNNSNLGQYSGFIELETIENDSEEYIEAKQKYLERKQEYESVKNKYPEMSIEKPNFKEEYFVKVVLTARGNKFIEWFEKEGKD